MFQVVVKGKIKIKKESVAKYRCESGCVASDTYTRVSDTSQSWICWGIRLVLSLNQRCVKIHLITVIGVV